jgi:hypothetical protein
MLHGIVLPRVVPLEHQRAVVGVVHKMFPMPTSYIDRCSMISSYPQAGFFMTTWGLEAYRHARLPVLRRAIDTHQPPLLIADHPLLNIEDTLPLPRVPAVLALLDEDRTALSSSYVPFWGPLYVAGKRLGTSSDGAMTRFDLLIAGRYTLEASGPVRIDNQWLEPGRSLKLERGAHSFHRLGNSLPVILRWADVRYQPREAPPKLALFLGF